MNQLNNMMKSAAESLVSRVQSYFDEFDQICLSSDVMNKDDDSNQSLMSTSGFCVVLTTSANQHKWGQFSTAAVGFLLPPNDLSGRLLVFQIIRIPHVYSPFA